jgi:hypothetical protein
LKILAMGFLCFGEADVAQCFAPAPLLAWRRLESLRLRMCVQGINCMRPLALALASGSAPGLQQLRLENVPYGDGVVSMFINEQVWPVLHNLVSLYLYSKCHVTDEGACRLAAVLPTSLHTLSLEGNEVGNNGAVALAGMQLSLLAQLQRLDLSFNEIGCVGSTALAEVGSEMKSLDHLNLAGNQVKGRGVIAFAGSTTLAGMTSLRELILYRNPATVDAVLRLTDALIKATQLRKFRYLLVARSPRTSIPRYRSCWKDGWQPLTRPRQCYIGMMTPIRFQMALVSIRMPIPCRLATWQLATGDLWSGANWPLDWIHALMTGSMPG